jgi:hypothetical protein
MVEEVVFGRVPTFVLIAITSSISQILIFERSQPESFRARDVNGPARSKFRYSIAAVWHLGRIRTSEHYADMGSGNCL